MSKVEMKVPTIGESITEVTLSQWLKKDGEWVNIDEPICEFESDKATLEFPAEGSGILHHVAKEGDDLAIGALVATIDTSAAKPSEGKAEKPQPELVEKPQVAEKKPKQPKKETVTDPEPKAEKSAGAKIASPAAAKILREADVTQEFVDGSGKGGRITKEDAKQAATNKPVAARQEAEIPVAEHTGDPVANALFSRNEHRKKMSRMRRTIARRLVSAKNETAMLTTFNELDMTAIMDLRTRYQDQFVAKYGIKLGFMSLFAKACAKVLLEMPEVNAFVDGEEFVYHDYVDISIAISTPNGLVVPPVRNIESLGYHEIEFKIKELAEKARAGTLALDEMQGGTFTITNGGIFGSLVSTPIINEPQSAILGMHAIKDRPVVIGGEVVIRPMMYLALSYDHRVIDGSSSVTFLVKVKEALEDPVRLLLGV
jgi:2-oxoglutarate dehydrogenase E2 component (dihydrolipoamide succinyltransferase)